MILLTACAQTPTGKTDLLAFLQARAVNRYEVYRHLGDPSAVFESCHVLIYRVANNKSGYYLVSQAHNAWRGNREGDPYDVVITLNDQGLVQSHNLVPVKSSPGTRKPKPSSDRFDESTVPSFIAIGKTTRSEVLFQLGNPDGVDRTASWFWYGSAYRGGYEVPWASHSQDSLEQNLREHAEPRLFIAFDIHGVVQSASILQAACWEMPSQEICQKFTGKVAPTKESAPVIGDRPEEVVQTYDHALWSTAGTWIDGSAEYYGCRASTGLRPTEGITQGRIDVTHGELILNNARDTAKPVTIPWVQVADLQVIKPDSGSAGAIFPLFLILDIANSIESAKVASWLQARLKDHSCLFLGQPSRANFSDEARKSLRPFVDTATRACGLTQPTR